MNQKTRNTCVCFPTLYIWPVFSLKRMKIHATFALLILALSGEISSCKPSPEDESTGGTTTALPTIIPDGTTTSEVVSDGSTVTISSVEPDSTGLVK